MLVIGIGNLSFAGLMAAYARGPVARPALRTWMWARVALGLCQVGSSLNMQWNSDAFAQLITLGWIGGMALELAAYCLFYGFAHWRRVLYPVTVLSMLVLAGAQLRGVSVTQLVALVSTVVGLFAATMGIVLLWPRGGTPVLQRIIGTTDAVMALAMLLWVWSILRHDSARAAGSALIQSFAFFSGYILMIVKGFGFLLLCKQEDDRKMLHLATVDSLTGLLNRHAFFDQAQALRQRANGASRLSLLMLDLDHFKRINDCFGHATGDAALHLFARAVQGVLAGRGVLGRLGGEEFALALAAPLDDTLQVAEQLRMAITQARLPAGSDAVTLSVSIGVAALVAGEALDACLARADQALYDAKRAGRNCVRAEQAAAMRVRAAGVAAQADPPGSVPLARQQFFA